MRAILHILTRRIGAMLLLLLAGGLLTALMVRFSPGFETDERELDPRLSQSSRLSLEKQRAADGDAANLANRFARMVFHADLGESPSLKRPIGELLRERLPVTAEIMAIGVIGGWTLAFALAMASVLSRRLVVRGLTASSQQVLICLPAAALAIVVFDIGGPVRALVALIICPRVFDFLRNLLHEAYQQPHILAARAKGLGEFAVWAKHVMPYAAPQLFALAATSVSIAFGAAIPVEALCDLPGIGQLAWLAATARDLPLLVVITLLVIAVTQACNMVSDWAALRRVDA
ncbi:MAG TPA: ABC transporter permease [Verrucomicrobiae bacterium]|nr:ABC transporter permease [Verrucomicrobiae bacterium]